MKIDDEQQAVSSHCSPFPSIPSVLAAPSLCKQCLLSRTDADTQLLVSHRESTVGSLHCGGAMIIPIRCFTCGKVVANKYETYLQKLADGEKAK